MNKKMVATGLTAGLLASAGVVFALDSVGASATAPQVVTIDTGTDTASDTGTDTDRAADQEAHLRETLQALVDDDTLTTAQLDEVVAALVAAGPGDGAMGHGGPGGRGGANLQTVADLLGLTSDEVRTAIEAGTTIADLAEQNGSSAQKVIDALVAELTTHLADEVAAGTHTQAEVDARLTEGTARITEFVNNTQAAGPMGGGHGPGHGRDGDHADGAAGTSGAATGGAIDGGPADQATTTTNN